MISRCAVAILVLAASPSLGHDIWLAPDAFVLARGDTLIVRQMAGEELAKGEEELALFRRMTPRFELLTPEGRIDLLAELPPMRERPEVKPVLERRVEVEGLALVAMEHAFLHHEMTSEKFLEYLEHEGLEVARYRPHMERGEVERERYARSLRTLVRVGRDSGVDHDLHKRTLGQKLEILLLQNPYDLAVGEDLDAQILLEGRPLADQTVAAYRWISGDAIATRERTDDHGVARFTLDTRGLWLLRLVHLIPCSRLPDGCEDVDWESYWASLTFAVP